MDLGLGVLEEIAGDKDDTSSSEDEAASSQNVMGSLMNIDRPKKSAGIVEIPSSIGDSESELLCDPALRHYRTLCSRGAQFEMDIVISLMSRILIQMRKHRKSSDVDTITKINVLQEDMYKLMSKRDRLIEQEPSVPKHETLYLNELDDLLKTS